MTYVASFDGTNDFSQVADSSALRSPASALTMAGWYSPTGDGQDWHTVAAKELSGGAFSSYAIFEDAAIGNRAYLGFVASGSTQYFSAAAGTVLATGAWYFLALTWQSGQASRLRAWNTAGTLVINQTGSSTLTGSLSYSAHPFRIGGLTGEVSASRMGCWGIHNAVLTDAQLRSDANSWFNTGRPPIVLAGPFWDLENTWANNATYGSSQSNTLSPQNGATFVDVAVPWTVPGGVTPLSPPPVILLRPRFYTRRRMVA